MPVFQAGDAGANPVEAAISLRKRRLLIRSRSPLSPHRILLKLAGSQSRQGLI